MANLKSLIRLRKHNIDEKQKFLADLFRQAEEIDSKKNALAENLEKERQIAESEDGADTRDYFGLYAEGVKKQIERFNKDLAKLEVRIQIAQDEIREAFADLKRIEIVQKNREDEEAEEQKSKEEKELNDIAIEGFRRREEG